MPKGVHGGNKRIRTTKLIEVGGTIAELGAYLRDKCDVVIVGENHSSVPSAKVQKSLFESIDPTLAFVEGSPSIEKDLNDPSVKISSSWHDEAYAVRSLSLKRGTKILPVDIEHCKSAESVRVATLLASLSGSEDAYFEALGLTIRELKITGRAFNPSKPASGSLAAFQDSVDQFVDRNRDVISSHNIENLEEAREAWRRELHNEPKPLGKIVGEFFSPPEKVDMKLFEMRNEAMAQGIEQHLRVPDVSRRASTLSVGMDHNKGVEARLESKGFRVTNIKIVPSIDPSLDAKVYFNPRPSSREDAEWVVTVYDPKNGDELKQYSFSEGSVSRDPADIPRAKMVLETVSR